MMVSCDVATARDYHDVACMIHVKYKLKNITKMKSFGNLIYIFIYKTNLMKRPFDIWFSFYF